MFHVSSRFLLLAVGAGAVVATGCTDFTPDGDINLLQPQLQGWQNRINLLSKQVHWTTDGRTERLLAEFPLPGGMTGKETYLLYLRWPAGERELIASGKLSSAVQGFFIQTRGENAGKAEVVKGKVTVSGTSQSRRASRRLTVTLTCEDGTQIAGRVRGRRDDWYVTDFETRRRPADVQELGAPPVPGRQEQKATNRN